MSKKKIDFFFQFFLVMTFFFTFCISDDSVQICWGPPLKLLGTPPGKKVFVSKKIMVGPMTPKLMVLSLLMGYMFTISLVVIGPSGTISTRHRFFSFGDPGVPSNGITDRVSQCLPKKLHFPKIKKKKNLL